MTVHLSLGTRRRRAIAGVPAVLTLLTLTDARRVLRTEKEVVAADPEALAVAYDVARRRPDLVVRVEESADPDRRPAPADLAVVTPWYPSPNDEFAGAFVRAATAAVRPEVGRVSILHTESWFHPAGRLAGQLLGVAAERQALRSGNAVVVDTAEGELTRIAVPTPSGGDHLAYADEQTRALRAALPTGRIEAPVVHAHVGILGGVVAARLARPDARLVVTEHATFLAATLSRPAAKARYAQVVDRADLILCVGRNLRDLLAEHFPAHVAKLRVVPNAIDFDAFPARPAPPVAPTRWLYVGRLMAHKGVLTVLEALAAADPRTTLTLAGSGPLEAEVDERTAALGLGERVQRLAPVPPDDVAALMHDHDLLVHASHRETFGMTVVEAIATGTPVLVALSEGPAETLDGIAGLAGGTFAPTDDPAVLLAAYHRLRARFGELDVLGAREVLRGRYGRETVAGQLLDAYAGGRLATGGDMILTERPVLQRLTARVSSPVPEAVVRLGIRIGRRLGGFAARWGYGSSAARHHSRRLRA